MNYDLIFQNGVSIGLGILIGGSALWTLHRLIFILKLLIWGGR